MKRNKNINKALQKKEWDIIVIGGGATGLGIALEAVTRGLTVLLLEAGDFACQTSSVSTKLCHGGIRYLKDFNLARLLESAKEQSIMQKQAPHLLKRTPFFIPIKNPFYHLFVFMGLKLFDLLTFFIKRKFKLEFNLSRSLSLKEVSKLLPNFKYEKYPRGITYLDCQFDDARFAFNVAQKASELGGDILNYFKVTSLLKEDDKIIGVKAVDGETQIESEFTAKIVVNATGPYADSVICLESSAKSDIIDPIQGSHIVLGPKFAQQLVGVVVPSTGRKRVFYAIPWFGHLILGTTETRLSKETGILTAQAQEDEISYLLNEYSNLFNVKVEKSDITSVFSGIRPLLKQSGAGEKDYLSREHAIFSSDSGLLTVAGGKWTTYHEMARQVVDFIFLNTNLIKLPSVTSKITFVNSEDYLQAPPHLHCYGSFAMEISKLEKAREDLAELIHPDFHYTWAMVYWAIHHEGVLHLDDILLRRIRLMFLNVNVCLDIVEEVAQFMAKELNRDQNWVELEIQRVKKNSSNFIAIPN